VNGPNVIPIAIFEHKHEIWHLSACPTDKDLFFTVYNTVPDFKASLWKLNEENTLTELIQLDHVGSLRRVLWRPYQHGQDDAHTVVSIDFNNLVLWDLEKVEQIANISAGDLNILSTGSWNVYDKNLILTASGSDIIGWDIRDKKRAYSVSKAHTVVRDIDNNPNPSHKDHFVSCGDDSRIKFWDERKMDKPVKVTPPFHSHWVWRVQYHPMFFR